MQRLARRESNPQLICRCGLCTDSRRALSLTKRWCLALCTHRDVGSRGRAGKGR